MLGSTGKAVEKAAEFGLPYSHAKFFLFETPAEVFDTTDQISRLQNLLTNHILQCLTRC